MTVLSGRIEVVLEVVGQQQDRPDRGEVPAELGEAVDPRLVRVAEQAGEPAYRVPLSSRPAAASNASTSLEG
jgi:hypothetical protein